LGYYFLKSKEADIPFRCTASIKKELSISDTDLCIVLSNALENAIEACERLDPLVNPFVSVDVKSMNGQLLIKIENTYNGHLEVADNRYVSTKDDAAHGIGMRNIQKVVESYDGYLKIEHNDLFFTFLAAFPDL
jgi:sensor histidine kinase regulating citrate/malate metabolism